MQRKRGNRRPDRHQRRLEAQAPNPLRKRDSQRYATYTLTPEFTRFVDEEVLPHVELPGRYKQAEKRAVLRHATHNLILNGLVGRVVADGRKTNDERRRQGIWDALVEAGFAELCLGSEVSGYVTRYAATGKLLAAREYWKLNMLMETELERNTALASPTDRALVVLHTGKTDPATGEPLPEEERRQPINFLDHIASKAQPGPEGQPDPRAIKNGLDYWRAKEDTLESINAQNMAHGWAATCTHPDGTTTTFQPNVAIRQIHVGDTFEAARLYSFGELSGQNLSKAVRRTIRIDGEPAAEWDYSAMHPRMLYRRAGITRVEGDPYKPEVVLPGGVGEPGVREFIKRATNACLNCRTRPAAHSAIAYMLRDAPNLRQAVGPVPDLVDRLLREHVPIAQYFFTGIGMELMTEDGKVMMAIMRAHRDAGKPALPIHDAVVCKASDADWTRGVMEETYFRMLAHWPVIERVF